MHNTSDFSQGLVSRAEFLLHPVDAQRVQDMQIPTISVDRAIGHLVEDFQVDIDSIQNFYYGLPHSNKLNLEDVHIHFSAARPVDNATDTVIGGNYSKHGTKHEPRKERKITPELKPTHKPTIVVYLGRMLIDRDDGVNYNFTENKFSDSVNRLTNEALAHELTHFAQTDPSDIAKPSKIKRLIQLTTGKGLVGLLKSKKDLGIGFVSAALSEISTGDRMSSIAIGVGTTAISYGINRKDRRIAHGEKEFKRYKKKANEIDANFHQENATEMCRVTMLDEVVLPKGHGVTSFVKPEGEPAYRAYANDRHRELSSIPRGGNPREIRRASMRSELKSIRYKSNARARRAKVR